MLIGKNISLNKARGKSAQSQRRFFHQKNYPQKVDTDLIRRTISHPDFEGCYLIVP